MAFPTYRKLALSFDPHLLQEDLARVTEEEWVPHYEKQDFEGYWSGVSLHALNGQTENLRAIPGAAMLYAPTPLLGRCPYFQKLLQQFHCSFLGVRLLRLEAGSRILPHADSALGEARGEVRLHVPVQTSDQVDFRLAGERLVLREGECWYLDLGQIHSVDNPGSKARTHLILDCMLNDWLRNQIMAFQSSRT